MEEDESFRMCGCDDVEGCGREEVVGMEEWEADF